MDVTKLSDEDLKRMLTERGFVPGPILDSTRRVYQKKLARMLETDVHAEGAYTSATSFEEQEYSSVDEDEDDMATADTQPIEELMARQQQTRNSPRRRQQEQSYSSWQEQTSRSTVTSSVGGDSSHLTRRSLRQTSDMDPSNLVTQVEPPPQQQKKGGLSLCTKLVILVVFALIVFLVIQNMEPAAKDPVAGIGTD